MKVKHISHKRIQEGVISLLSKAAVEHFTIIIIIIIFGFFKQRLKSQGTVLAF